jgi:hypothetical protein
MSSRRNPLVLVLVRLFTTIWIPGVKNQRRLAAAHHDLRIP